MQVINQENIGRVWTPSDFLNLGNRAAVDKVLQRLVHSQVLQRIDRGLYSQPRMNSLTGQLDAPDYRSVIDAVSRRDQVRILLDGMTCANDLGLTNAVPGQVIIHTDGQLRPIQLGKLIVKFKLTAPSKLYWAGRPAMRIVQALYWLHDQLQDDNEMNQDLIQRKLIQLLQNTNQKDEIIKDLQQGIHTLPFWMQQWVKEFIDRYEHHVIGKSI